MPLTPDTAPTPPHHALKEGVLFKLDLGLWTGSAQLDAEDLGLTAADVAAHFHLGRKRLVAKEAFAGVRQVADRTKYLLDRLSTPLPDGGRFVIRAAVPEVLETLHTLRRQFDEATETFLHDYPAARAAMRPEWEAAARLAWAHAGSPGVEAKFVEAFLARVDEAYPEPAALAQKFRYVWYTYELTFSGLNAVDAGQVATEERAQRERDAAYAAEVHARIDHALEQSVAGYRAQVAEAFQTVLEHVVAGRAPTPARLERLRRTIERFRKLDIFGDEDLEQTFRRFEADHLTQVDPAAFAASADLRQTFAQGLARVVAVASTEGTLNPATGRLQRKIVLPTTTIPAAQTVTHEEPATAGAAQEA